MTAKIKKALATQDLALSNCHDVLTGLLEQLQETFDNRSEKWQEGEKGEEAQTELDALQSALDAIEGARGELEPLCE